MAPVPAPTRSLSTAEVRREALLEAALPVFAVRGYHATSTMELAKAAGISQAYVFRLFASKLELYVAVVERAGQRMLAAFKAAAAEARRSGEPALDAMGRAYVEFVRTDRDVLLVQIGAQVAGATEPAVAEASRRCFAELFALATSVEDASAEDVRGWFAHGMLINTMAALGADAVDEPWAQALTAPPDDCAP